MASRREDPHWGWLAKGIISGGEPGVERGALEAAIELDIPHAGFWSADRTTELDPNQLADNPNAFRAADRQTARRENVEGTDGTLVIAPSPLCRQVRAVTDFIEECGKPMIHLEPGFIRDDRGIASGKLKSWYLERDVSVLNVTGVDETLEPGVRGLVRAFLTYALRPPDTFEEAVVLLMAEMPDTTRNSLANLREDELIDTHFGIGQYVRNAYGLFRKNCPLTEAGEHPDNVSARIVKEVWRRLCTGDFRSRRPPFRTRRSNLDLPADQRHRSP